jgi:hypothetical protein
MVSMNISKEDNGWGEKKINNGITIAVVTMD